MKNLLLKPGLIVLSLFMAPPVMAAGIYNKDGNKLDLYGKIDVRHVMSSNASENGDATYSRFGFKGQTQISDRLTGYGQWEYKFMLNHTEGGSDSQSGNATRAGFAGL